MLKLLLAHWKAHRTTVPPDLTFEPFYLRDPIIGRTETTNPYTVNRINPIYESDSRSSTTPAGVGNSTSANMAGDTPPPTAPKPSKTRGGILRNGGTRQENNDVKNQSTTTDEMNGVTRSDCAKDELPQSIESSSKPSTPPNPSEDSGITRGDQATSDSVPSDNDAPPAKQKTGRRRYNRHVGPRACKKCRRYQKPGGKWSCDDYYTRAILEDYGLPDGWTSDMSGDLCPSCDPLDRNRNRRSFHVLTPMPEREELTRYPPDGSPADPPILEDRQFKSSRTCPCGRWYDALGERDRYERLQADPYFWPGPCYCGNPASIYYSQRRKVKFAGEVKKQDTDTEIPIADDSGVDTDAKKKVTSDVKSELSDDSRSVFTDKSINALKLEDLQRNYPWTAEGWDSLVRQRILQKRRRRAFYMGVMALTLVVFVGLIVAIVLIYLRRKNA